MNIIYNYLMFYRVLQLYSLEKFTTNYIYMKLLFKAQLGY